MSSILNDLKHQYNVGGFAQRLIFWNIGIFIISLFFIQSNFFENIFALSSNPKNLITKPWTIVSYGFLHHQIFDLIVNMLLLQFACRWFTTFFNEKQLQGLYFLGIVCSGAFFILWFYFQGIYFQMVGASAAIMTILMAATVYAPLVPVPVFLIGKLKLWMITATIILFDLLALKSDNMGGHLSHLAGAFLGFLFVKFIQNGTDLSRWYSLLSNQLNILLGKSKPNPFRKIERNYNTTSTVQKKNPTIVIKDQHQQQVDAILDKISLSGYDSLSQDEKNFLFKIK